MKNNFFVIDVNTVISAFVFKLSKPREALEKAIKTGEVATSLETYEELSEVLLRSKFDKYISLEERLLALKQFKELAVFRKVS